MSWFKVGVIASGLLFSLPARAGVTVEELEVKGATVADIQGILDGYLASRQACAQDVQGEPVNIELKLVWRPNKTKMHVSTEADVAGLEACLGLPGPLGEPSDLIGSPWPSKRGKITFTWVVSKDG